MKGRNRTNTLLIELLIVVFFFMMGSVILIQVFGKAHEASVRARLLGDGTARGQSVADLLYAAADPEAALREAGFTELGVEEATKFRQLMKQNAGTAEQEPESASEMAEGPAPGLAAETVADMASEPAAETVADMAEGLTAWQLLLDEETGGQIIAWLAPPAEGNTPGLRRMLVSVWQGEELLLSLPCSKYAQTQEEGV